MIRVFWRNHNGKIGNGEVATHSHIEAIQVAVDALKDEWKEPPHPVLALVKT